MNQSPNIDLIALIEGDLGPGKKSGRWMIYRCPFSGHKHGDKKPSFRVTNGDHNRPPWWKCFGCGKGGGAIKWLMEYRGLSYADALSALKISPGETGSQRTFEPPIQQPDTPPGSAWQARALQLIRHAEAVLWSERGKEALEWLRARGLKDETIRDARLGYIPRQFEDPAAYWGTPKDDPRPIYLYRSVLIPGIVVGRVWYLKMRTFHPKDFPQVRGSVHALYLADQIAQNCPTVFCEGELDALLLKQEIQDLASVVTLGGAQNQLNLATWGLHLLRPSGLLRAYDMDEAGNRGDEKLAWIHNSQRLKIPELRLGDKDLTDFHKSGGNLYSLIENALNPDAPIFITWPADAKPATIDNQFWRNPDTRIEAFYSPDQLKICLEMMRTREEVAA